MEVRGDGWGACLGGWRMMEKERGGGVVKDEWVCL